MLICLVVPHLGGVCWRMGGGGGGGTRPISGYGNILNFIAMFGTNNKIHTVLFETIYCVTKLLQESKFMLQSLIYFWKLGANFINQVKSIMYCMQYPLYNWGQTCTKLNTLFWTNFHAIVYPVWDREDKNHTTSFSSTLLRRPYKGLHPQVPKQHLQKFWKFIPWGV